MQNSDYLIMAAMVGINSYEAIDPSFLNDINSLTKDFTVQALLISMSGMIHMQIQTGMGRHRQWSDERPHVFRLSMKVLIYNHWDSHMNLQY